MTERDLIRNVIEKACAITGKQMIEHDFSISITNGPKYLFTAAGQIKSIIKNGKSYSSEGERGYTTKEHR